MAIEFRKNYEYNMKLIADNFQQITANFKVLLERIESLEARLMKLEKTVSTPHFEGETES